jgi:phosphoglycerate kinase
MKSSDAFLIGGAMAYTFLKSQGLETGRSLVEDDKLGLARELLVQAKKRDIDFVLPADNLVVEKNWKDSEGPVDFRLCDVTDIKPDEAGLDIGRDAIAAFSERIASARTIIWNGPMGMFERKPFDQGTRAIAMAVAASGATSIVGGGDSVAAVTQAGLAEKITHVSTGGGASLEFLAGETLPGVAALTDK